MANKCVLVVVSNPMAGREDEYNEWYTNQHLADVLKEPGFLTAQRFRIDQGEADPQQKYLAIYEFEADNPTNALAALNARAGGPDMVISEAMDMHNCSVMTGVAITAKLIANQ